MIEIDGSTATIIAALLVVLIAVVGFVGSVPYRLGKQEKNDELLAQEIRHSREVSDAQHVETMLEIRRLIDALYDSHSSTSSNLVVATRISAPQTPRTLMPRRSPVV